MVCGRWEAGGRTVRAPPAARLLPPPTRRPRRGRARSRRAEGVAGGGSGAAPAGAGRAADPSRAAAEAGPGTGRRGGFRRSVPEPDLGPQQVYGPGFDPLQVGPLAQHVPLQIAVVHGVVAVQQPAANVAFAPWVAQS